jgi:hypothetical protein
VHRDNVPSSAIASIGYDQDSEILEVEFVSGKLYRYQDVPFDLYVDFLEADSKGQFFNDHIRDAFIFSEH